MTDSFLSCTVMLFFASFLLKKQKGFFMHYSLWLCYIAKYP